MNLTQLAWNFLRNRAASEQIDGLGVARKKIDSETGKSYWSWSMKKAYVQQITPKVSTYELKVNYYKSTKKPWVSSLEDQSLSNVDFLEGSIEMTSKKLGWILFDLEEGKIYRVKEAFKDPYLMRNEKIISEEEAKKLLPPMKYLTEYFRDTGTGTPQKIILPKLTGSEKQIKWAEKLRSEELTYWTSKKKFSEDLTLKEEKISEDLTQVFQIINKLLREGKLIDENDQLSDGQVIVEEIYNSASPDIKEFLDELANKYGLELVEVFEDEIKKESKISRIVTEKSAKWFIDNRKPVIYV